MAKIIRSRSYAFTANNWSQFQVDCLTLENMKAIHIVYGKEVGDTGIPHLQGNIYYKYPQTMKQVHERCGGLSLSRTKFLKNSIDYCKKGEQSHAEWEELGIKGPNYGKNADVYEEGDPPSQGKRTDLHDVVDAIEQGDDVDDIANAFPTAYIKYHTGIEKLHARKHVEVTFADYPPAQPIIEDFRSMILIGEPEVGKTQWALAHFPKGCLFVNNVDDLKTFNPRIHSGIVFDDMCFKHLPPSSQKFITDYEQARTIHARFFNAKIPKHTRKIFCCNEYPFLDDDSVHARAIRRRLIVVKASKRDGNFFFSKQ